MDKKISQESIDILSVWVSNMKNFVIEEKKSFDKKVTDGLFNRWIEPDYYNGSLELLKMYELYREYIHEKEVTYRGLIILMDIMNKNPKFELDRIQFVPWLNYFTSCGRGQWAELWKSVESVYNKEYL